MSTLPFEKASALVKDPTTSPAPLAKGPAPRAQPARPVKARVEKLSFWYGEGLALRDVSLDIHQGEILALIGPSGCGKTTLLRCFNRMHDLYPGLRYEGRIEMAVKDDFNVDLLDADVDPIDVRLRVGMVFQKPNPFPKSIFENVAYGLRIRGIRNATEVRDRVEAARRRAAVWDEVANRLDTVATRLSGGQQQRLCIARALAMEPEILLFDEPTSALDPISTAKVEELMVSLRGETTTIVVTHNMAQARRISDRTGFLYMGELIECDRTARVFDSASHELTRQYVSGRFG